MCLEEHIVTHAVGASFEKTMRTHVLLTLTGRITAAEKATRPDPGSGKQPAQKPVLAFFALKFAPKKAAENAPATSGPRRAWLALAEEVSYRIRKRGVDQ